MEGAYYTHWLKFTNVAHRTTRRLVVPGGQSACLESVMSWAQPQCAHKGGKSGRREGREEKRGNGMEIEKAEREQRICLW